MSNPPAASESGLLARLSEWARPREGERRGTGSLRLAETTVLVLAGLFLAIATVNDVVGQTHVNHRLLADQHTWQAVTGHDYHNLKTSQDLEGHTTRDTVCGNTSPGGLDERTQLCLSLLGPVIDGRRAVSGGYYLVPKAADGPPNRYACFGAAAEAGLCGLSSPPAGSPPAPPMRLGRP